MPLCLERDAADKLPGNIGTREDIGTLLRNSQYIAEGIPNREVNPVVQGDLNCLHYRDVFGEQFGRVRKLWVYLHGGYEERHSYIPARNDEPLYSRIRFIVAYGIYITRFGNEVPILQIMSVKLGPLHA